MLHKKKLPNLHITIFMADALKQTQFFFPSSDLISCVIANNNYFTYTLYVLCLLVSHYFGYIFYAKKMNTTKKKKNYPKGMKKIYIFICVTV